MGKKYPLTRNITSGQFAGYVRMTPRLTSSCLYSARTSKVGFRKLTEKSSRGSKETLWSVRWWFKIIGLKACFASFVVTTFTCLGTCFHQLQHGAGYPHKHLQNILDAIKGKNARLTLIKYNKIAIENSECIFQRVIARLETRKSRMFLALARGARV